MKAGKIILFAVAALLQSCATTSITPLASHKAVGPKVIALDAARNPLTVEIERRLRARGFRVLRLPSQRRVWIGQKNVFGKTETSRMEAYNLASARYILDIDSNAFNKCLGGGYALSYVTAELVDTKTNETVISMSGSGSPLAPLYTENCTLANGHVYQDIVNMVERAWISYRNTEYLPLSHRTKKPYLEGSVEEG